MIGEYILLVLLLVSAVFIIVAVTMQKTSEDGLSGTIVGGSETYYGKDKSVRTGRILKKWTLIATVVFGIAVTVIYVIQPDYTSVTGDPGMWKTLSDYASIFK